ncbi:PE-PPE domain-containing protein [Mycobacterium hubeiense]|uniref:PE-PPE domain-containing protein n=1 Tax=Mycobacterium hubeiense TaxID=1867256 RepID=UPI00115A63E5|nr:PE-PPE domain-containing protein [Mycobacterium sp. QGD 101]
MRRTLRSLSVVLLAVAGTVALGVSTAMTAAVQLLATTALIMGGAAHPMSTPPDSLDFVTGYMADAEDHYIDPGDTQNINRVAVIYPAQFFPVFGTTTFDDSVAAGRDNLNGCLRTPASCDYNQSVPGSVAPAEGDEFKVFGYSESAVVASLVKRDLIEDPTEAPTDVEFFLIANPMRPNGGILARGFEGMTIPIVGITFHGPTPTDGNIPTTDVAQQYDMLGGDAPASPWNLLAWANSAAAYYYLHGQVPSRSLNDPMVIDQGTYGDTHYYLIPARRLPILIPLEQAGVPGPILAVIDAPLRVLVEAGHVRTASPGEHVQFQLLPTANPVTVVVNVAGSIPVGIDDGVQEAGLGRPLGTADVFRPFGVGGTTYDKVTGEEVPSTAEPAREQDPEPAAAVDTEEPNTALQASTPDDSTPPRKRGPLRSIVRESFDASETERKSLAPARDRPLKRILGALTGQRSEPADTETKDPGGEADTGAADDAA